ncbi:flotillin family protein [Kroppenstedtia pulmonis]|uniref:Flotillin family protein n=1 Tax=Kroppenstedtia pulmonis TaxID=1380685 RepID=A0A7D4CII8_9BACL|nr:flotillin family protein [Kroppenstedtia pulmonis]QKG86074.1 flotillin family protein [Kroppenstedtia pulmonis]
MTSLSILVFAVAGFLVLAISFWARYKTVGADDAMIVTGSMLGNKNVMADDSGRKMKIIRGGGAFIIPIFQQAERLSLLSHKLTVSTPEVYTEQGVPVMADGVAIIKIGGSLEDIATAAEQFMGKKVAVLKDEAEEVLEGHLRAILGTMTVEEIYKNRERFAQEVQAVAAKDLKKMGLQIVSFTIKDVRDNNGYLEALGRPRIAAVRRDADIAEANARRDTEIQTSKAREEGTKATLISETHIAEAEKEKEIQIAQFKIEQDMKKAEADQAYQLQENRYKQQVVDEEMKIDLVRKNKAIELEEKEIIRREKQYDAEVRKKADADRYSKEQAAQASRFEREAQARAEAEAIKAKGIAEAQAHKSQGEAQADVIRAKGLAEAEAKEKLAEAFDRYGQAAILDLITKMLPELAGKVAEPMGQIDKITVVDSGSEADGATRVSQYVTRLMAQAPEMVQQVSGLDINQMIQQAVPKPIPPVQRETEEDPDDSV